MPWSRNSSYLVSQPLAGLSDKANWFSTELVLKGKEEEREKDAHLPHLPVSMTPPDRSLDQLQKLLSDPHRDNRRYARAQKVGVG